MSHSSEPWIEGCWEREQRGRKVFYVFRTHPTDIYSETAVYSGVKDGDEIHCSDWDRGRVPGHVVIGLSGEYSDTHLTFEPDDLDRALKCVNAMKGIKNPQDWVDRAKTLMENT